MGDAAPSVALQLKRRRPEGSPAVCLTHRCCAVGSGPRCLKVVRLGSATGDWMLQCETCIAVCATLDCTYARTADDLWATHPVRDDCAAQQTDWLLATGGAITELSQSKQPR